MMFSNLRIEYMMILSERNPIIRFCKFLFFKNKVRKVFRNKLKSATINMRDVKDYISCCKLLSRKDCMFIYENNKMVTVRLHSSKENEIVSGDYIHLICDNQKIEISIKNDTQMGVIAEKINERHLMTRQEIEDRLVVERMIKAFSKYVLYDRGDWNV